MSAGVAIVAGLLRLRPLVVLAGLGFLAGTVLQVVQASLGGTNTLGGDGSTAGLHLGFAALPVLAAALCAAAATAVACALTTRRA